MLNVTKSDAFYSSVGVCVCVWFCVSSLSLTSTCKSPPDLMFVRSRDDNFLPLCLSLSLALKPSLDKRNIFLVDDSCNVSSLLYYSPLQLLITNVVVSFCFLLIDFASTLTDKLVKLKVFCSFSLSSYSLALSLTIFAPFVFSYFLGNSNSLLPSCSCFDFCLTKRNELTLNGKNKHFFTQLSLR